jgi:hypothetical protein
MPVFRDGEGTITARAFIHDRRMVGLQGAGYRALRALAEQMQGTSGLSAVVTVDRVEELIFTWLHGRHTGRTRDPMSEWVLAQLDDRVASFEVVVPLFRVLLPEPISIGRVTLRTITRADFERWGPGLPMG